MEEAGASKLVVDLVASLVRAIGYIVVILATLPILDIDTGATGPGLSASWHS